MPFSRQLTGAEYAQGLDRQPGVELMPGLWLLPGHFTPPGVTRPGHLVGALGVLQQLFGDPPPVPSADATARFLNAEATALLHSLGSQYGSFLHRLVGAYGPPHVTRPVAIHGLLQLYPRPLELTVADLHAIIPTTSLSRLKQLVGPLNATLVEFEINTLGRVAAFLGNALVESDYLKTFTEYASGSEYEGRTDLGNMHPGDGVRYKGRGIIQITGRTNYGACGTALGQDLLSHPELLATDTSLAVRSGGWYWTTYKHLNRFADQGAAGFANTVYRVNGAVTAARTHWPDRVKYYKETLKVLGAPVPAAVPTTHG